jgi:predicted NBD/HSP70 family sugar kinase
VRGDAIDQRWAGVDVAAELRERLPDVELQVDGDAGAAALAEATLGAGRDHEFVAYVRLSHTVGMGLVLDRRPFRGASSELGHVLIDPHGPICRCGNRGCLETVVSGHALSDQLKHSHGELGLEEILELAAGGDRGCQRVIYDAGRVVGLALADLCNTAGPDVVVVGGELVAAGDLLMDPLRAAIRQHVIRTGATEVSVVASPLGERAELLGALVLGGHGSADVAAGVAGGASKRRRGQ